MYKKITYIAFILTFAITAKAQYISEVLEYKPAPGQYINSSPWGIPGSVNSIIGDVNGTLSLGSFGGYVVFKFANPVENDPGNPYGIDFTIFGNPLTDWSEPGIVWVMNDENGNRLPDDTWYELAGSEYFFSSTIKNYEVTYTNPGLATATDVPWTDNQENSGVVVANEYHAHPYYPMNDSFPDIPANEYTLAGTYLAHEIDKSVQFTIKSYRKAFGYTDNQYRGSAPYTLPDNPYTPEVENSGGDAFDISWAVNDQGEYIDLDVIHFVKVQNAVLVNTGMLGELSTEITGAVDVPPDNTVSGPTELLVLKNLPDTIEGSSFPLEAFAFDKGKLNNNTPINWIVSLSGVTVNDENLLAFTTSGKAIISASLQNNPEISVSDSTVLVYKNSASSTLKQIHNEVKIYPNPASDILFIEGPDSTTINIFDLTGNNLLTLENHLPGQPVSISHLPKGLYMLKGSNPKGNSYQRFVKQ